NNNGGFSTDFIGANYDYPEADYATRAKIWQQHEDYIRGLLTFLATDSRVPEKMRAEMQEWGLCKDEFQDTGGWPHALYVREARRMLSDYVMTEADCRWDRKTEDPVGLGAYNMDSHNCQRLVKDGRVVNEGDVQVGVRGPYPVSYRSIIPKAEECENLLVPVCLSATHIAYGSIRMEPVFMILAQSAATAATIALDGNLPVQKVAYAALREKLVSDKQILEWTGPAAKPPQTLLPPPKLDGIVLDDTSAEKKGDWLDGSLTHTRRVGEGYIHDGNEAKGEMSVTWSLEVPADGEYEIVLHFPPNPNRATNVPATVTAGDRTGTVKVNERDPKGGG
ncbi:MAG: FAD-dependent oxidoreductase, partial [Verrucomicrobiaceae bacterium]